ncbi:hypothetical protein Sgleb_01380 [Streptomyces glebosus]|uniref:Uncharacterized protein n=1 Tax=Streptomyces glebosus TaxID=249580 RepID=A0A640SP42_9ACTN|nr:hypothetical protein Sgleb_01380 [Streptomyces glebosus]GHG73910.1 hypothetical protein GCM10010513_47470 [Streptomyces glebosus]
MLVPLGVVTVTCTVPLPTGLVAVIWVSELTTKDAACVAPKRTAVAPVKPVPVTVTAVPPAVEPDVGETDVTVGVAARDGAAEEMGGCAERFTAMVLRGREPRPAPEERYRTEARHGKGESARTGTVLPVRAGCPPPPGRRTRPPAAQGPVRCRVRRRR